VFLRVYNLNFVVFILIMYSNWIFVASNHSPKIHKLGVDWARFPNDVIHSLAEIILNKLCKTYSGTARWTIRSPRLLMKLSLAWPHQLCCVISNNHLKRKRESRPEKNNNIKHGDSTAGSTAASGRQGRIPRGRVPSPKSNMLPSVGGKANQLPSCSSAERNK